MVDLRFEGAVGRLFEGMGVGLNHLEVVQTDAGPMVVSVSGRDGGVICIGFDAQGRPRLLEQRYHSANVTDTVDGRLALIDSGSETVVVVGAGGDNALVGYRMTPGGLGPSVALTATQAAGARDTLTVQTDNGFIYSAASDGSLRGFSVGQNGALNAGALRWDNNSTFHQTPTALESVTLQGRTYLLCSSAGDTGVSVFAVNDANGRLTPTGAMGINLGLGLFDTPADLATAQIGGKTFVIVASRGEATKGAALSVMELTAEGQLIVADHILDNLSTRFGAVSAISVVEHNGFQYLLAGGGDQGVDLFTLLPSGKLVHLDTITTAPGASLDSVSDLTAVVVGGQLNLLLTSHQRAEITALSVDLSGQGRLMRAGDGGEALSGAGRDDIVIGGAGADRLSGGAGDDILSDGAGADTLTGGAGADRFVIAFDGVRDVINDFNPAQDRLDLSQVPMLYSMGQIAVTRMNWGARLTFRGEELDLRSTRGALNQNDIEGAIDWAIDRPLLVLQNEVRGGRGADTLEGTDGSDAIYSGNGNDLIHAGDGADKIDDGAGADTVFAGAGNDTVRGSGGCDEIHLDDGDDVYLETPSRDDQKFDIVFGDAGNDTITSAEGGDELHGGAGNDSLVGGADGNRIFGGVNFDTIRSGAGDDSVWGGNGRDLAFLGAGNDVFYDNAQGGVLGRDTVFGGSGNDTIAGGNGDDVFFGDAGNDVIFARLGNDRIYGGDNNDIIHAGDGADLVYGGNGRDRVYLNQGNDLFVDNGQGGESGRDTVFAGYGNDTIQGGNGDDVFFGEWGNDIIHARRGNDTVYAGDGDDRVWGGDGRDETYLGAGADIFWDTPQGGVAGRDTVFAGGGNDTIQGGNGDDRFFGENGSDLILARLGNDSVYGGSGFDTIDAGAGDDVVFGGNGRDRIYLGHGDDIYVDTAQNGRLGQDTINGGPGADTFVFGAAMSRDVIVDFQVGVDRLALNSALTGGATARGVVQDLARVSQEGVVIDFGDGQSLQLENLTTLQGLADAIDIL